MNYKDILKIVGVSLVIGALIIGGGIYFANKSMKEQVATQQQIPADEAATDGTHGAPVKLMTSATTTPPAAAMMTVKIPLGDNGSHSNQLGPYGCGTYLAMTNRQIPSNPAVLGSIYTWMFSQPYDIDNGAYANYADSYGVNYSSVSLTGGVAKLYLTGSMVGPGHCAEPAFKAQVGQAAFQFPTVSVLEVYVNGQLFNWCSISDAPEEGNCANGPQLWRTVK